MGKVSGSNPLEPTIQKSAFREPFEGTVRRICDDCSVLPALIDHLDLRAGRPGVRHLCQACADAELALWRRESRDEPAPGFAAAPSRRAA